MKTQPAHDGMRWTRRRRGLVLVAGCLLALWSGLAARTAVAAAATTAEPMRAPAELKEMAAVEQFLRLSDAELDQMTQVIARIRAMTPEQRAALLREVGAFRRLPEQQRWQMRQGWGQMPREVQEAWREMMQHASDAQRAEIQAKMPTLSPEEKVVYRKQLVDEYLKQKAQKK